MRRSTLALPALAFVLAAPVQAQDSLRILDPQSLSGAGAGWSVDPATGRLGLLLPFAAVPGEIPLALPFEFKASHAVENRYVTDPNWEACLTCGTAPKVIVSHDRPIHARIHFGYITPPMIYTGYTDAMTYVLEDGTQFRARDFKAYANSDPLQAPSLFGLASKAWSQVQTHVSTRFITYDATLSDLGTWSYRVQSLAPTGFTLGTGYKILMDKDRARIHVFLNELQTWVPILWVDRFNHFVGFQWKWGSAAGCTVTSVKALNQRNVGLQVQWAEPASGQETEQVLLRADYLGVQAPSVQVTGYSGISWNQPSAMGGTSDPIDPVSTGPVLRPTQVKSGDPSHLAQPSWMAAGLPVPSPAGWDPWGADLQWTFAYDAAHAELASFTDPRGITTTFGYATQTFFDGTPNNSNQLRAVMSASGGQLTRTWTRTVPTYSGHAWTQTSWVTSFTQSGPGYGTEIPTREWTFVSAGQGVGYGNAALQNERLYSYSRTWATYNHTPSPFGIDGSLTKDIAPGITQDGQPTRQSSVSIDSTTGLPSYESLTVNGTTVQTTNYLYDSRPGILEPGRPSWITTYRITGNGMAYAPAQGFAYDYVSGLPTRVWAVGWDSTQRGQNFSYDGEGHLQSVSTYPSSSTSRSTSFSMGSNGLPANATTTFSSPNGGTTSYNESWSYNTQGRVTSATDGRGVTTSASYDARGRIQSQGVSGLPTTTYSYPTETQMSWYRGDGLNGGETTDALGRLISRALPDGTTQTFDYDQLGRVQVASEMSRAGASRRSTTTYDPLGRPIYQDSYATPLAVNFSYMADGPNARTTVMQTNGVTSYSWTNGLGQVVKTQDPWTTTSTTYNVLGQPLQVQQSADTGTQIRSFGYTGLGYLSSRTEPETNNTTTIFSGFDALGNPSTFSDGVRTCGLAYDGLGRLRSVTGGSESLSYVYNGLLLASATTVSNGETLSQSYAYNGPAAQLSSETLSGSVSQTLGYGYDWNGRLNSITYPSGRKAGYAYDSLGRVNSVSQTPAGSFSAVKVADIAFDDWGNRNQVTFASGARSQWTYGFTGANLQSWTVTPLGAMAEANGFAYDGNGNMSQGSGWTSLTHDTGGRLTAASGFGENVALSHDGFGNNLSSTLSPLPLGANNFGFYSMPNNQTPSLTSSPTQASTGWSYQVNGEATQIGTATGGSVIGLSWDGLGRMNAANLNGVTYSNTYAASGMRVRMRNASDLTGSRIYAYTSGGQLLGEYDGSGTWKRDVVYLGGEALAEIDGSGTHELHNDHLGSPRVITSQATGAAEGRQVFGPYGEVLPNYTSGYQPLTGFTGHVKQDPSGLIYMRGRFYTPAWHRFLNSDHGVDPMSWNQMAYVGGSPFQLVDPSGMRIVKRGEKTKNRKGQEVTCNQATCDTDNTDNPSGGWVVSGTVEVTGTDPGPVDPSALPGTQYGPSQTDYLLMPGAGGTGGAGGFGGSMPQQPNPCNDRVLGSQKGYDDLKRLFQMAGSGFRQTERSAWLGMDSQGNYSGMTVWSWSAATRKESWSGPIPAGTFANVHTHPMGTVPYPSESGGPSGRGDLPLNDMGYSIYILSRQGIYKRAPGDTKPTQLAGSNWMEKPPCLTMKK